MSTGSGSARRRSGLLQRVPQYREQRVPYRDPVPSVERDQRAPRVDCQRPAQVLELVREYPVEKVDRDHERQADLLEVVDRGVAVVDAPRVDDDEGTERAVREVVPHEPEAVLAGRAEQVQLQLLVDRDAAEVQRDGGRRLRRYLSGAVDLGGDRGDRRLGGQWRNLGDDRHGRGLADPEASGDDDLDGYRRPWRPGNRLSVWLRVHGSLFRSGSGLGSGGGWDGGR